MRHPATLKNNAYSGEDYYIYVILHKNRSYVNDPRKDPKKGNGHRGKSYTSAIKAAPEKVRNNVLCL